MNKRYDMFLLNIRMYHMNDKFQCLSKAKIGLVATNRRRMDIMRNVTKGFSEYSLKNKPNSDFSFRYLIMQMKFKSI